MKRLKKFTSAALAITMALISTNVYAVETEKTDDASNLLLSDSLNANAQLSLDGCETTFNLDSFDLTDSIIDNSANGEEGLNALSDTGNTKPVAGLSYMVANPDTLLNGSFTTDTIIYWL